MVRSASVDIEVRGARSLIRALRLMQDVEAPFVREAMEESGQLLTGAARGRAPGGIAQTVDFIGVRGSGARIRATVKVRHPGAKSMEFGRRKYYRGFTGRRQRSGQAFQASPGQRARPFVGIRRGDAAVGAVKNDVGRKLIQAYEREWARVAGRGD